MTSPPPFPKHFETVLASAKKDVLAALESNEGWKQLGTQKGVARYTRVYPGTSLLQVKGVATLKRSPYAVYGLFNDLDSRPEWDEMYMEGGYLAEWPDTQSEVNFTAFRAPLFVSNRDYVAVARNEIIGDGNLLSYSKSVEWSTRPPHKKYTRGSLLYYGVYVEPLLDGNSRESQTGVDRFLSHARQCRVTYVFCQDPNGMIPNRVTNMSNKAQTACISVIDTLLSKRPDLEKAKDQKYRAYTRKLLEARDGSHVQFLSKLASASGNGSEGKLTGRGDRVGDEKLNTRSSHVHSQTDSQHKGGTDARDSQDPNPTGHVLAETGGRNALSGDTASMSPGRHRPGTRSEDDNAQMLVTTSRFPSMLVDTDGQQIGQDGTVTGTIIRPPPSVTLSPKVGQDGKVSGTLVNAPPPSLSPRVVPIMPHTDLQGAIDATCSPRASQHSVPSRKSGSGQGRRKTSDERKPRQAHSAKHSTSAHSGTRFVFTHARDADEVDGCADGGGGGGGGGGVSGNLEGASQQAQPDHTHTHHPDSAISPGFTSSSGSQLTANSWMPLSPDIDSGNGLARRPHSNVPLHERTQSVPAIKVTAPGTPSMQDNASKHTHADTTNTASQNSAVNAETGRVRRRAVLPHSPALTVQTPQPTRGLSAGGIAGAVSTEVGVDGLPDSQSCSDWLGVSPLGSYLMDVMKPSSAVTTTTTTTTRKSNNSDKTSASSAPSFGDAMESAALVDASKPRHSSAKVTTALLALVAVGYLCCAATFPTGMVDRGIMNVVRTPALAERVLGLAEQHGISTDSDRFMCESHSLWMATSVRWDEPDHNHDLVVRTSPALRLISAMVRALSSWLPGTPSIDFTAPVQTSSWWFIGKVHRAFALQLPDREGSRLPCLLNSFTVVNLHPYLYHGAQIVFAYVVPCLLFMWLAGKAL